MAPTSEPVEDDVERCHHGAPYDEDCDECADEDEDEDGAGIEDEVDEEGA